MSRGPSLIARKRILTAALQVFSAKGYREATVRDIARTAGVSVGALYPYFGNKEQLYTEVLVEQSEEFNERIRNLEHQDPEMAVRSFIETHLSWVASKKQIVSRHFKDYDLEFANPFRTRFWTYQKEFLEALICKGVEQGLFRVGNCGDAAVFVLWALKGALFYDLAGTAALTRSGDALCELSLWFLTKNATGAPTVREGAAGAPLSTPMDAGASEAAGVSAGGNHRG
jgi:AcrR family transcriptional regulator